MMTAASRRPSARDGVWPAMIVSPTAKPAVRALEVARPHRVTIDQCLVERR